MCKTSVRQLRDRYHTMKRETHTQQHLADHLTHHHYEVCISLMVKSKKQNTIKHIYILTKSMLHRKEKKITDISLISIISSRHVNDGFLNFSKEKDPSNLMCKVPKETSITPRYQSLQSAISISQEQIICYPYSFYSSVLSLYCQLLTHPFLFLPRNFKRY